MSGEDPTLAEYLARFDLPPSLADRGVLTEDDVRAIRKLLAAGELQRYVAAKFKVGNNTISAIATGKTWGWLK